MKKFFKVGLIVIVISIIVLIFNIDFANAKTTNKGLAKKYCKENYQDYKIKYFTKWNEYTMTHRKGKRIVYIEKIISYSSGNKYGYTQNGYYIAYNKKVKKGNKVISYCIYNPYSNYPDDIIAVIDCKKIR